MPPDLEVRRGSGDDRFDGGGELFLPGCCWAANLSSHILTAGMGQ